MASTRTTRSSSPAPTKRHSSSKDTPAPMQSRNAAAAGPRSNSCTRARIAPTALSMLSGTVSGARPRLWYCWLDQYCRPCRKSITQWPSPVSACASEKWSRIRDSSDSSSCCRLASRAHSRHGGHPYRPAQRYLDPETAAVAAPVAGEFRRTGPCPGTDPGPHATRTARPAPASSTAGRGSRRPARRRRWPRCRRRLGSNSIRGSAACSKPARYKPASMPAVWWSMPSPRSTPMGTF
jgi:hypothetical protein